MLSCDTAYCAESEAAFFRGPMSDGTLLTSHPAVIGVAAVILEQRRRIRRIGQKPSGNESRPKQRARCPILERAVFLVVA